YLLSRVPGAAASHLAAVRDCRGRTIPIALWSFKAETADSPRRARRRTMTKREVLQATSFGKQVSEQEVEELSSYFVETEQWRRVFAGEVDVVYGAKGSGKSAIYS